MTTQKAEKFATLMIGLMSLNTILFLIAALFMISKIDNISKDVKAIEIKPIFHVEEMYVEQKDSSYLIYKPVSDTL